MLISLVFSITIYRVSSQEFDRSLRPGPIPRSVLCMARGNAYDKYGPCIDDRFAAQIDAVNLSKNRLRANLFLVNILILITGGLLSYYLARKTLGPIEEAHEAQSRFTADASHELRTPITAMRAETEITLTEKHLTLKNARKQLESNIEELDKLTSLSEGLLRLARLDNNGLEKDSVLVSHVIQQAVERLVSKAEDKQQIITTSKIIDSKIPINQPSIVEALVTILDNAIKYSPKKSQIHISSKKYKNYVHISIKDSGVGIRQSELQHIFDRFYRADNSRTKSNIDGYGIGLSIAMSVAKAHGGDIKVTTKLDGGSAFSLVLPA